MRVDSPAFHAKNTAKVKEPRFVVGIIFDVDSIYITSHTDIADVPGTVINGALSEPSITSQRLKPDEAVAEIGSASFSLVDLGSSFTEEVRERLQDGAGLRGKECRFYLGYAGDAFSAFQLIGTQIISEVSYQSGRYAIGCLDVQRTLRKDIFDARTTTLSLTVAATDTTINVTSAAGFQRVFHGPSYSDAPNSTVGYLKIKNEVIRYSGVTSTSFTGCVRGVFGTLAETYTVDPGTPADRREKVTEYVYLELPAVKLAYAILTGTLYGDGVSLPDGWHLDVDPSWVRSLDFVGVGTDLWNPADDSGGFVVRFEGLSKQDGKRFLEKELYLLMGLFSPVYANGTLGLKRMVRIRNDAAHVAVLDESNSIQVGDLVHDMKSVHNTFTVSWSWNGTEFRRQNKFIDIGSFTVHGPSVPFEVGFKGLYGGIHSDGIIFQTLDAIRDAYAGPPERLSVEVLHSLNRLEVGDIVRCRYMHVRDFAGEAPGANDPGIDRAFQIHQMSVNHRIGRVSLELFGSTADASISTPTNAETALDDAVYTSAGTALSSAPGITIAGGVITAATLPLTGHSSASNSAAIYYHDDDLELAPGVTLAIRGNVQLRICGFLQVNGTIDGVGGGQPGIIDDGRALLVSAPDELPEHALLVYETIPGAPGYVGGSRGGDGVYLFDWSPFPHRTLSSRRAAWVDGRHAAAPEIHLGDGLAGLSGLDLRGTGGAPGGRGGKDNYNGTATGTPALGGSGAAGGAGLVIVSRGMALGANGLIDLSGGDSAAPSMVTVANVDLYAGAGGSGGPGTMYVLLDGANLSVPDFGGGRYRARSGVVPQQGTPLEGRGNVVTFGGSGAGDVPEPVGGFADPDIISGLDMSGSTLRIQYIPASETPIPDQASKPPPLTGLTATGVVGGIALSAAAPPTEQWDVIEYYGAAANDRTGATLAARVRADAFTQGFPAATTRYYWARTRANGIVSDWFPSSPTDGVSATSIDAGSGSPGESVEMQFSVDGSTNWHSTFASGDLYARSRIGSSGTWQGPWRIVGEDGDPGSAGPDGNITSFIFQRSATAPAAPTGNSPVGWTDAPPAHNGNPLWMSRALKTPAGILVGSWSVPQIIAIDGEDGAPGLPGIQGPGLFTWANPVNVTATSTSIQKTGGSPSAWNAGAHSMQSYSSGCFVSARPGETNTTKIFGLNDDPAIDVDFSGINFAWRATNSGVLQIFESGAQISTHGSYTTDTVLALIYDGANVQYLIDGVVVRTVAASGLRLFLDVSLFTNNASWRDIAFGPSGSRGEQGDEGPPGAAAQSVRLTATSQVFTFDASGAPAPAVQTITFASSRQNISTPVTWSTSPSVPLTGTGDSRTLSVVDFGGNSSVRVTASVAGFSDSITVVRLQQGASGADGQPAITGLLTNESHTLSANPDGVISDYSGATGYFRVYEGVLDRSSSASYSIVSASNCTAQINTADNTPVSGQPRGFYRVTAVSSDQAFVDLQATLGSVVVTKRFTIVRSRQGTPGDGTNLLRVEQWVVGSSGSQGTRWAQNGTTPENAIVLGGAGTAPLGPLGITEPLWECRPSGDNNGDGGWNDNNIPIDRAKTYRSTCWFRVNQISGSIYHGARTTSGTYNLNGTPNTNPYFVGGPWANYGLEPNQWYLSVGLIHGAGYTGVNSGISGIYDPRTGARVVQGSEFRMAPDATLQGHRAYHFYDSNTSTRQWMGRPRFEEINGNEPSIWDLMSTLPPEAVTSSFSGFEAQWGGYGTLVSRPCIFIAPESGQLEVVTSGRYYSALGGVTTETTPDRLRVSIQEWSGSSVTNVYESEPTNFPPGSAGYPSITLMHEVPVIRGRQYQCGIRGNPGSAGAYLMVCSDLTVHATLRRR